MKERQSQEDSCDVLLVQFGVTVYPHDSPDAVHWFSYKHPHCLGQVRKILLCASSLNESLSANAESGPDGVPALVAEKKSTKQYIIQSICT